MSFLNFLNSLKYDREQLEKTLPPLLFPDAAEVSTSKDWRVFEKELDARLNSLAQAAGCTPVQCVALAMWLGSQQGWSAFEIDMSDCAVDSTDPDDLARNALLAGFAYGENGEKVSPTKAARGMNEAMHARGMHPPTPESLRVEITNFRKERGPETRGDELTYLYKRDERRARLLEELKRCAARLSNPS